MIELIIFAVAVLVFLVFAATIIATAIIALCVVILDKQAEQHYEHDGGEDV